MGLRHPTSTCDEAEPLLRGTVFTDRGVYRLGEEVHFKAILRSNTPGGIRLLPDGHAGARHACATARTSVVDERTVTAERLEQRRVDADAAGRRRARQLLGARDARERPAEADDAGRAAARRRRRAPSSTTTCRTRRPCSGSFLVAAYRRPDFRVDVTLTGDARDRRRSAEGRRDGAVSVRRADGRSAGALDVHAHAGRYGARRRSPTSSPTSAGCSSGGRDDGDRAAASDLQPRRGARSTATGELPLTLDTEREAGVPYVYTLEGDVEDVSRQHIANRASLTVHPAPWYVGVQQPPYFVEQKDGPEDRGRRRRRSTARRCRACRSTSR